MTVSVFKDRADAGLRLAWELGRFKERRDAVVLAVPRGGMPVGAALARELDLPLGAVLVHRVPHPDDPAASLGCVTLDGLEPGPGAAADADYFAAMAERQREALRRRYWVYREAAPPVRLDGAVAIVVDDEAATGGTMLAALRRARRAGAARVFAALPAATDAAAGRLREHFDGLCVLATARAPEELPRFYEDFAPVSEERALEVLRRSALHARG